MQTLKHLWDTSGYWLGLVLAIMPTFITGLTKYPNAQGFLRKVVDFLSLVSHKDSPGTFKAPLVKSKPPSVPSATP